METGLLFDCCWTESLGKKLNVQNLTSVLDIQQNLLNLPVFLVKLWDCQSNSQEIIILNRLTNQWFRRNIMAIQSKDIHTAGIESCSLEGTNSILWNPIIVCFDMIDCLSTYISDSQDKPWMLKFGRPCPTFWFLIFWTTSCMNSYIHPTCEG